jgi:PAS domain S-box-containing protein
METLAQMPALVVLDRVPIPVLAVGEDGTILFANGAAAEMLGYTTDELASLRFDQLFHFAADASAVSVVRAHANRLVELVHADGSRVRAAMSGSAMLRGDDPVALATFQDLTEQLWVDGP